MTTRELGHDTDPQLENIGDKLVFDLEKDLESKRGFVAHKDRMLGILTNFPRIDTEGMRLAIALHDVVSHSIINAANEDIADATNVGLNSIYAQLEEPDSKHLFTYSLGIGTSVERWEQVAERWREPTKNEVQSFITSLESIDSTAEIVGITTKHIKDVAEEHNVEMEVVAEQLLAALTKDETVSVDPSLLTKLRPRVISLDDFLEASESLDVEGLIIKTIETVDNLQNPKPGAKASAWRDSIEVLSFYGPALELFGFEDLAATARGVALEYVYSADEYDDVRDKARAINEDAKKRIDSIGEKARIAIATVVKDTDFLEEDDIKDISIKGRPKSVGGIMEKMITKYKSSLDISDAIGLRLTISDTLMQRIINDVTRNLGPDVDQEFIDHKVKLRVESISEKLHTAIGSSTDVSYLNTKSESIDLTVIQPRRSGYKAVHLNYELNWSDDEEGTTPFEVQVTTDKYHKNNTYGQPSHYIYKMFGGKEPTRDQLAALDKLGKKSEYLIESPDRPVLAPQAWFDILHYMPELPTEFHRTHHYVSLNDGDTELAIPHNLTPDLLEGVEFQGSAILPAYQAELSNFLHLLKHLVPDINIETFGDVGEVAEYAAMKHSGQTRRSSGNKYFSGHILPTTQFLLLNLHQDGWLHDKSKDGSTSKHDDAIILLKASLLHDTVEDTPTSIEEIRRIHGDKVADLVKILSKNPKPESGETKAERDLHESEYLEQVMKSPDALRIKFADRIQNTLTDIVDGLEGRLSSGVLEKAIKSWQETIKFLIKPMIVQGKISDNQLKTALATDGLMKLLQQKNEQAV